jgi:hypothetical protein
LVACCCLLTVDFDYTELNGKFDSDSRAAAAGSPDSEDTLVLLDAFTHAGDSDTLTDFGSFIGMGYADADAVIGDLERNGIGGLLDADDAIPGFGVAMNIGERFLDDAEQSDLQFAGHAFVVRGNLEADAKAGTIGEAADVSVERSGEARFFEHWRMEKRGD